MSEQTGWRDLAGGAILLSLGLFVTLYSIAHYEIGQINRMGPGFFPMCTGVFVAACGLLIAIQGVRRPAAFPSMQLRPTLAIAGSGMVFAGLIAATGLIPAAFGLLLVACLADKSIRPGTALLTSGAIVVLAVVIFKLALGMSVSYLKWPF